jgi:hypothetical protein
MKKQETQQQQVAKMKKIIDLSKKMSVGSDTT